MENKSNISLLRKKRTTRFKMARSYSYWTEEEDMQLLQIAESFDRKNWKKISLFSRGNVNVCYGRFKTLMNQEFSCEKDPKEVENTKADLIIAYNFLYNCKDLKKLAEISKMDFQFVKVRLEANIIPKLPLFKEYIEKKSGSNWIQKEYLEANTDFRLKTQLTEYMCRFTENTKILQRIYIEFAKHLV